MGRIFHYGGHAPRHAPASVEQLAHLALSAVVYRRRAILQDRGQRENFLGVLGPLLLFVRFGVWALALILGFALLQWGAGELIASPDGAATFGTLLYYSGTTFFTVALGDLTPLAAWPRALNILEAATGFMFLGLVISYLPTFYADYARREARISQLDAWASSPPSAGELLSRLGREDALPTLDSFFGDWETWSADVMESHLSYPILALFRSQHEDQSWVSALATVLDVSALVLVGIDGVNPRAARLAFAMARHAAVDLSQVFGHPRRDANVDRLPSIELARLRAQLSAHGVQLAAGQAADARLFELRAMYEPLSGGAVGEAIYAAAQVAARCRRARQLAAHGLSRPTYFSGNSPCSSHSAAAHVGSMAAIAHLLRAFLLQEGLAPGPRPWHAPRGSSHRWRHSDPVIASAPGRRESAG